MHTRLFLIACVACFSAPAPGADLSPGLWEITVDPRVAAAPNFSTGPLKLTQCLSAADARDPSKVLGGISNPGASGCTYTNKNATDNRFSFTMQCSGSYALQSHGEVSYTAESMTGTIAATANVAGQKTEITNRVSARRLGAC